MTGRRCGDGHAILPVLLVAVAVIMFALIGCTATKQTATTGNETPPDTAFGTTEDETPAAEEGAADILVPSAEVRSIVVTTYGATIDIPDAWQVTEDAPAGALHTFIAEGPDGAYVRVDENLEWDGELDPLPNAQDLSDRLAKKYDDYRLQSMDFEQFKGLRVLRWHFTHTTDEGEKMDKTDVFFQANQDRPPCAILLAVPAGDSAAATVAQAILDSLVP